MAQGFVQAQDRLWQMESNRRLAAGRLSELIGSAR
jgi:penicillin amidase